MWTQRLRIAILEELDDVRLEGAVNVDGRFGSFAARVAGVQKKDDLEFCETNDGRHVERKTKDDGEKIKTNRSLTCQFRQMRLFIGPTHHGKHVFFLQLFILSVLFLDVRILDRHFLASRFAVHSTPNVLDGLHLSAVNAPKGT